MKEINSKTIDPVIGKLLTYATIEEKIEEEYEQYISTQSRTLFAYEHDNKIVACMGIEENGSGECAIRHIAVDPLYREAGIGKKMIEYVIQHNRLDTLHAETDQDAVNFYKKLGFMITSLGEKYPGIERFSCKLNILDSFDLALKRYLSAWRASSLEELKAFISGDYQAREVANGEIIDFGFEQSITGWEQGFTFVKENNAHWILNQISTIPLREDEKLVIISASLEMDGKPLETANLFFQTFKKINFTDWKLVRSYIEAGIQK